MLTIIQLIRDFGLKVDAYDCEASSEEVARKHGINLINTISERYDGILLAVPHTKFSKLEIIL